MKTFIILLVLAFLIAYTPEAHALFGHVKAEQQRRINAEQRLAEQQHLTGEQQRLNADQQHFTDRWRTLAFVFGIASVIMLITGTAIGSKTRRDHER